MINELQSQEWAYLLDPCFQLVNTNGKPLTNGHIEVFYHGTRTPYYCASDWNGTLHPFKINIDSLGSNVVLADPNYSYDVYVYNAYGVLQMSRYNVNPGSGGSGGSSSSDGEAPHWNSDTNGGASSSVTGGTTVYLTLPSSEDQPDFVDHSTDTAIFLKEGLYHIDAVVSFKQDEDDLQNIIKDLVVNTGLMGWDAQMTGQKNWTGPESTDDDRHFLELHTVVSVPEDLLQPLYFQISSPVDLDSAAIEKLDIIKLEAGGNGIQYAAGYGIDITGQVISTSGMMPESSAANFVNVETYNTDIQNIYETIAETSAMIPSGVATEQWVEDYVASATTDFVTTDELTDALNGYATQEWVVDQGYLTSADLPQSVPLVAGEGISIVDTSASTIISIDSAYSPGVSEEWVVEQGYITSADLPESVPLVAGEGISIVDTSASTIISIDSAYSPGVSEEWVEEYVSDATSGFITSADIPDVPEDLVTSAELATVSGEIVNQIPDVSDMATQTWVNQQGFLTSIPEDLVTSGELATVSGAIMGQMPTQTTVSIDPTLSSGTKIAEFNINGTSGELFAPSGSGGSSWSEEYVDIPLYTFSTTTTDWQTIADYASAHGGMAPVGFCEGDGQVYYPTLFQPEYKRVRYVSIYKNPYDTSTTWRFSSKTLEQPFSTSYWREFVTGYIGQSDWNESNTDNFSYIQNKPDLSSFATSADLATVSGDIMSQMPTQTSVAIEPTLQTGTKIAYYVIDGTSGELYAPAGGLDQVYHDASLTGDGTSESPLSITSASNWTQAYDAINDSASYWNDAAGMNEYPISAGPGMSIEDVSGVTVFGPDVPYLTQAVGADETVLFNSSTATTSGSLSEAITNFEKIRIYGNRNGSSATNNLPAYTELLMRDGAPSRFVLTSAVYSDMIYMPVMIYSLTSNSFSLTAGSILNMSPTPTVTTKQTNIGVLRIVGINRISGGNS